MKILFAMFCLFLQLIGKQDLKHSNVQERVVRRRLSVLGLYHHDVGRNHGRNDLGAIHKMRRHFFSDFLIPSSKISAFFTYF